MKLDRDTYTTPCFGMSNEQKQVFVLGAAGYIGGAILVGYKKAFPTFQYTALIRNEGYVPAFEGERDDVANRPLLNESP